MDTNDHNYGVRKLKLSVSTKRFERKEDIVPKQLKFEQDLLTVEEFEGKVKGGNCFCHWFNTTKDVFSIAEKTKNNFYCANVVFIDVDDYDVEMKEFVKHLPRQPTIYYTTRVRDNDIQLGDITVRLELSGGQSLVA